jgi:hypothetical protein
MPDAWLPATMADPFGCGKTQRAGEGGLNVQSPLGESRTTSPFAVTPKSSDPLADANAESFSFDAVRSSVARKSRRRASPLSSTNATTPPSASNPRTRSMGGTPESDHTAESNRGLTYARAVPPLSGTRRAIWSRPREAEEAGAPRDACRSPLQATTSVSAKAQVAVLETRSQREGPVRLASRFIERFRVIPLENRKVEQIHAKSETKTAKRITLEIQIIIRGLF